MFYPTIVIAVGDLAHLALKETEELLRAFQSPARFITALGVYQDGFYHELSAPSLADSAPLESTLMRWLYTTRAEVNIDRAREAGMEVGPPAGYLLEQVLLVVDSHAYSHTSDIVSELQMLCERAHDLIPTRLHWLILHPSYDAPLPQEIVRDHQERLRMASALQEGKLIVLRLVRSDGSNMTPEQLRETVAYLLLGALHTAQFEGEHWLFRSVVDFEPAPSTLGCGLVTLPLHRIERALQDKFIADALREFLQGAKTPLQLPALEENGFWRAVVSNAAQAWAVGETERIKVGDGFSLNAQLNPPQVNPRSPDLAQLQAVSEWETRWQHEKLPRWQQLLTRFAHEESNAYLQNLRTTIQEYLHTPGADLNTVIARLQQLTTAIEAWNAHHLAITRPPANRKESLSKQLEKSIKEPPPRKFLGFSLSPRPQVDRAAVDDFTKTLQDYYGQLIQAEAHEAFKKAAQNLLRELQQEHATYVVARERIEQEIREHHERALRFRCERLPWLEPLVNRWEHLESTAEALWGNRNLSLVVARYVNAEYSLLQQLPLIIQNLQQQVQRWMTGYYRRFSYYLRKRFPNHYSRELWCQSRLSEMREQAERTLWHTEKGLPLLWQIMPPEESGLQSLAPHAPDRLWESDTMLGFVAAARDATTTHQP
jgi:hypothetical protein